MKSLLCTSKGKEMNWGTIYLSVLITYVISHGLMLTLYGAWWDDMLLWNVSSEILDNFMGGSNFNNPFLYYIVKSISEIDDIKTMTFVYRLVPFICWLISISAFFYFVKKISRNKQFTLYSSLLAASCGLNKCMIMINCYHYTISIMLFMIGLVLYTYDYYKEKLAYKILVALLWTLSLLIWRSAVLVIPVALLYVSYLKKGLVWNSFASYKFLFLYMLKHYWIIIAGLFVFAILYKTILAPQGDYAAYYSIGIKNMLFSPITTVLCCISLILGYISNLLSEFAKANGPVFLLLFFVVCIFSIFLYRTKNCKNNNEINIYMLLLACLFLFFSILPHLLRELSFSFDIHGYKSRVAALAIFPISLIFAYGLIKIRNKVVQSITCCILVVMSVIYCINTYLSYEKGWLKNEAIACLFKEKECLKGKNIVFVDNSRMYSPFNNEEYRYYDYEGCARLSYGKNDNTKCSELNALVNYKRFGDADYYIFINANENYSHIGLRSIFYRFSKNDKRDKMKMKMLSFRLYTKDNYASNKYLLIDKDKQIR